MSTLTIRLPDDKHERLKALAKSNSPCSRSSVPLHRATYQAAGTASTAHLETS